MNNFYRILLTATAVAGFALPSHADPFGSGTNQFAINFVNVGNAGNANDVDNPYPKDGDGGTPHGDAAYDYRLSVFEISQAMIDHATALGATNIEAGAWTGNQPAANINWYEAAAFVNWLNTSRGFHKAYDLTRSNVWSMRLWDNSEQAPTGVDGGTNPYRHKDAFYFLPSEDEWYKAAYHKNDGITSNYWDYPTGINRFMITPDGIDTAYDQEYQAVFADSWILAAPKSVYDAGSKASAYSTYGQGGNVREWMESGYDGLNSSASEDRTVRGGGWLNSDAALSSQYRNHYEAPMVNSTSIGFRVASLHFPRTAIEQISPTNVLVSWEPNLPGFVLQEAASLPPTSWTNSPNGNTSPVTVGVGVGAKFFRVVNP
jgi:formylglycine-generating enzyme